jgi:hypothetical protein
MVLLYAAPSYPMCRYSLHGVQAADGEIPDHWMDIRMVRGQARTLLP